MTLLQVEFGIIILITLVNLKMIIDNRTMIREQAERERQLQQDEDDIESMRVKLEALSSAYMNDTSRSTVREHAETLKEHGVKIDMHGQAISAHDMRIRKLEE